MTALCRLLERDATGLLRVRQATCERSSRQEELSIRERLRVLHAESDGTYGSPRMLKALCKTRGCESASDASNEP